MEIDQTESLYVESSSPTSSTNIVARDGGGGDSADVIILENNVMDSLQQISGSFVDNHDAPIDINVDDDVSVIAMSVSSPQANTKRNNITVIDEGDSNKCIIFKDVRLTDDIWNERLQDRGCSKDELKKRSYKGKRIPAYGTPENIIYYYDLASIAIDYIDAFKEEFEKGIGWKRVPKNVTEKKIKIIHLMKERRIKESDGRFILDQTMFLSMLNNQWGYSEDIITAEPNDKLRLFGIIMALDKNRHIFEIIASGATRREHIDYPEYNPSMMFQDLCLDFNNESILVLLPSKSYDVMGIE